MVNDRPGLTFSPGNHRYYLDKKPVPGVTTILNVTAKPAIPRWAASTVAEYVADNRQTIETLYEMGREPMVGALKGVPWQKRDDAAERGTKLHDYAENLLHGREVDVPDELVPVVENALLFLDEWKIQPVLVEAAVGSREHWYAGTLDLIADYTNPVTGGRGRGIFDWKSGKAIYAEAVFQLNAYAHAEFYGLRGDEKPVPGVGAAFGVHIRPDGYDVLPLRFGPDVFAEFLVVREHYEINKRAQGDWKRPGSGYVGVPVKADPFAEAS